MGRNYPAELQINKDNAPDTETQFLDFRFVSCKSLNMRDDFEFDKVNFPF